MISIENKFLLNIKEFVMAFVLSQINWYSCYTNKTILIFLTFLYSEQYDQSEKLIIPN